MSKNIILFGAPGAGKGTLANKIKSFSKIVHISTGDLFRDNIKNGTPIGKEAKKFVDAGQLVPDEVVIGMVKERISQEDCVKNGFMLDGFPRTLPQAQALDKVTKIDKVVVIDIDKQVLKNRVVGRRFCPKCQRVYNLLASPEFRPKNADFCDVDTTTKLEQRSDDNEATFEKRWNTYLAQSQDVIKYYESKKGLVSHIEGVKTNTYTDDEIREFTGVK